MFIGKITIWAKETTYKVKRNLFVFERAVVQRLAFASDKTITNSSVLHSH